MRSSPTIASARLHNCQSDSANSMRAASGLGAVILGWAARIARQQGREALRLDCVASNGRLRAYYEAAGFVHRGDVTVAGPRASGLTRGKSRW